MPHVIEPASSGRAKCRGCGQPTAKGELRFGERQPNAFGDGEMTLWFHLRCAAYLRPEPFLEALAAAASVPPGDLDAAARFGIAHRRVPRIHGAERAATGRARCRHCKALIDKGDWRIALVFFEEYRFNPGGFVHAGCSTQYFETVEIIDRLRHFSPEITDSAAAELERAVRTPRVPAA
jgi:hypothetical protein